MLQKSLDTNISDKLSPLTRKKGRPFGSKPSKYTCTCSICDDKKNNVIKSFGNSHKCRKCDKVITKWCHFEAHMRSHEGIRPYACHVKSCGSSFIRQDDLKRHLKCHSKTVRFTCAGDGCGMTFSRADHHKRRIKRCSATV